MGTREPREVDGVLLLYNYPIGRRTADTIKDHVSAFSRYSRFKFWSVNTSLGFPSGLEELRFRVIVFHYSLPFRQRPGSRFSSYLEQRETSYKVAFFQDEYQNCRERFAFLRKYKIDCVYTLLEPAYFDDIYLKYTSVPILISNIPGYVSEEMVLAGKQLQLPDEERGIDIGYRGRRLPFYNGKGGQEKTDIAIGFRQRSDGQGLSLDIEIEEKKRIYGRAWYKFLANCRTVLGVEAGVSIFDTEGVVRAEHDRLLESNPNMTFEEMSSRLLLPWENRLHHRVISPRHFEAAAVRTCQILFEGDYSGIMQPMVHYIPLKKDFSNFDEVIRMFKDKPFRQQIAGNACRDLIESGKYSYKRFINDFDSQLAEAGFEPSAGHYNAEMVTQTLKTGLLLRVVKRLPVILILLLSQRDISVPGMAFIRRVARSILYRYSD